MHSIKCESLDTPNQSPKLDSKKKIKMYLQANPRALIINKKSNMHAVYTIFLNSNAVNQATTGG